MIEATEAAGRLEPELLENMLWRNLQRLPRRRNSGLLRNGKFDRLKSIGRPASESRDAEGRVDPNH
jgi:hypothetical protein